jgi:hypothetical protein
VLVGLALFGVAAVTVAGKTSAPGDTPTGLAPAEPALPDPPATTERISLADDEQQGNGASGGASDLVAAMNGNQAISADGRWVVFASTATNLVPGSVHPAGGLFLRDRQLTTTVAIPWLDGGAFPSGIVAAEPAISADGAVVAFTAIVTGGIRTRVLVASETTPYVLAWDRGTNSIEVVSFDDSGLRAPGYQPTISGDGRFIAYTRWFLDRTPPTLSNLTASPNALAYSPCGPQTSSISVTATDPDDAVTSVTLFYAPSAGSTSSQAMTPAGLNTWQGTITLVNGWNLGQITYWVVGTDSHGNSSPAVFPARGETLTIESCIL